ncbi:arylacetamide deacetylase-like 4 [Zootoca vivipara]|uniref:arylacetamide deacetylase-like 4 n=1 Tax=Zootoca vivipara TaxID=8524 RepID=UPI0015916840|nr:arylacetamide deacetylase-like 4 [Zootoca vivipara]
MAFGETLWMLTLYVAIFIHSLLLAWGVYCHLTRTHIPPGITHGAKLRIISMASGYVFGLGLLLEKLGICHRYMIWRILDVWIPPKRYQGLVIKDLVFDGVPVRVHWPQTSSAENKRGVMYFHGGISLFGTMRAHERTCCYIAHQSESVVVNVNFRLAPEHLYPTPVLDCCTAATHFLKHAKEYGVDPNHIAIGGDSSGGTIATAVCQQLVARKDLPRVRAQFLIYPFVQAVDFNLPSHQQYHSVPPLFRKRTVKHGFMYLTGKMVNVDGIIKGAHVSADIWLKHRKWVSADNIPEEFKVRGYVPAVPPPFSQKLHEICKRGFEPMFSPLLAEDNIICQLPQTLILTCEYDIIRDDGLLYKKRLEDSGVPVTWHHLQDGFHGITLSFGLGPLEFPAARKCLQHVADFLKGT